jgi:broad specificity phosphatase PhoE
MSADKAEDENVDDVDVEPASEEGDATFHEVETLQPATELYSNGEAEGPDIDVDKDELEDPQKGNEAEDTQPERPPQPRRLVCVMRHSARLDVDMDEVSNASSSSDAHMPKWNDRKNRPYDTPISDCDLPVEQAAALMGNGYEFATIVCSPFRRCLQTAGVVARTLGMEHVVVHKDFGERMDKVRQECKSAATDMENHSAGAHFSLLSKSQMELELGEGVSASALIGEEPPWDESSEESKRRYMSALYCACEKYLPSGNILIVAHGDTLNTIGEVLGRVVIFEAGYCAWAIFDVSSRSLLDHYGVQMLHMDDL